MRFTPVARLALLAVVLTAAPAAASPIIVFKQYTEPSGSRYYMGLDDSGGVYFYPDPNVACTMLHCAGPQSSYPIVDVLRQGGFLYALSEGGQVYRATTADCNTWQLRGNIMASPPFAGIGIEDDVYHAYVVCADGRVFQGWLDNPSSFIFCGQWPTALGVDEGPVLTTSTWGSIKNHY